MNDVEPTISIIKLKNTLVRFKNMVNHVESSYSFIGNLPTRYRRERGRWNGATTNSIDGFVINSKVVNVVTNKWGWNMQSNSSWPAAEQLLDSNWRICLCFAHELPYHHQQLMPTQRMFHLPVGQGMPLTKLEFLFLLTPPSLGAKPIAAYTTIPIVQTPRDTRSTVLVEGVGHFPRRPPAPCT